MAATRARLYPFLKFAAGVDWQDVNPALLQKLNAMAAQRQTVVDVISGYRTSAHSVAVGGFADDPHTKGIAVDAEVGGKPVGSVFSAKDFQAAGLITGNQPNFFNGKPDPGHVQLPSSGEDASSQGTGTDTTSQPATLPTDDTEPTTQDVPPVEPPVTAPPTTTGGVSARPDVATPLVEAGRVADLWQQVTGRGLASPESEAFAANAAAIGAGANASA